MRRAFTLVELIIVISLVIILSICVLATFNPVEQKNRGEDTKIQTLITEIFKAHLRYSQDANRDYFSTPLVAASLNLPNSAAFLNTLISAEELKSTITSNENLNRIYLTTDNIDNVTLCFLPKSKTSQKSPENHFDKQGNLKTNCSDLQCHYCLTSNINSSQGQVSPTPDPCSNFNTDRPNFPWTTDYSSKWSTYGCTNYYISDYGCGRDTFCPSNQRHLAKNYYGVRKPNFSLCQSHEAETIEHYCVGEPYANCQKVPYPSSSTYFNYGCSNPGRPYSWK